MSQEYVNRQRGNIIFISDSSDEDQPLPPKKPQYQANHHIVNILKKSMCEKREQQVIVGTHSRHECAFFRHQANEAKTGHLVTPCTRVKNRRMKILAIPQHIRPYNVQLASSDPKDNVQGS